MKLHRGEEMLVTFQTRWPFFGPWFLRVVELAEGQGVKITDLSTWRGRYFEAKEPAQALSDVQRTLA